MGAHLALDVHHVVGFVLAAGRGGELRGGEAVVPLHCNGLSSGGTQQAPESVAGRGGELRGGEAVVPLHIYIYIDIYMYIYVYMSA